MQFRMGVYGASVQNQPGAAGAHDDDQDAFDGGTGGSAEEASAQPPNPDGTPATLHQQ